MATDHIVLLGFKDSPSGSDDYIDLNNLTSNSLNPARGVGCKLNKGGYSEGEINGRYREITINFSIEGTSKDDVIARFRQVRRYVQSTRQYFKRFTSDQNPTTPVDLNGNFPSRLDTKWHQGQAAVLTFQAAGSSKAVYWNIVDYRLLEADSWSLLDGSQFSLDNVTLVLIVEAYARGSQVILENLICLGDFPPGFSTSSGNNPQISGQWNGGWTFGTGWTVGATTPGSYALFGTQVLTSSFTSGSFTTNEATEFATGDKLVPSIWVCRQGYDPTITAKLQVYNGSTWSDQQTFINATGPSVDGWFLYQGTAYTVASGITKVRLSVSFTGSPGILDGFGIWKNPAGNVAPSKEYIGRSNIVGFPYMQVYNLQGDIATPGQVVIQNRSASQGQQLIIAGSFPNDPADESPIYPAFLQTYNSGATSTNDNSVFWGTRWSAMGISAGSSIDFNLAPAAPSRNFGMDRKPRLYRAFLVYAANDTAQVNQIKVNLTLDSNYVTTDGRIFYENLPTTYTGTGNPAGSDYRLYDLGDLQFSRMGTSFEEQSALFRGYITAYYTASTNALLSILGCILMPADQMLTANFGSATTQISVEAHGSATGAPHMAVDRGNFAGLLGNFNAVFPNAYYTGGQFMLQPNGNGSGLPGTANLFSILLLRSKDATKGYYTFNASDAMHSFVRYTPRYLSGMAS